MRNKHFQILGHNIYALLVILLLQLVTLAMQAQQSTGQITGVVTDSSGAAVPGAAASVIDVQTGVTREATTNSTGLYVLANLPVGTYTLKIVKQGFNKIIRNPVTINVNTAMTLNLVLQVGSASETVTVTSAASAINTQNQELGNYRYAEQWANLPVTVRETGTLEAQSAGIPYGSTDTVGGTFDQGGRSFMQIMSNGVQQNAFQTTAYPAIDGLGRRADLTMPNTDTIAEMRVVTNGSSAEYSAPTAIIVATKSGTNQFHGGLYEFYESGGLSARTWNVPTSPSFGPAPIWWDCGRPYQERENVFLWRGRRVLLSRRSYHTCPVSDGGRAIRGLE